MTAERAKLTLSEKNTADADCVDTHWRQTSDDENYHLFFQPYYELLCFPYQLTSIIMIQPETIKCVRVNDYGREQWYETDDDQEPGNNHALFI